MAIAFALPFGAFLSLGALISNLFEPFGFTPSELSLVALNILAAGIIGAVLVGILIDKTGKYKCVMQIVLFLTTGATIMIIVTLSYYLKNESMFIGWCEVLGFVSTGFVPLSLAYGAELTFPLQPALVNGTLTLLGSVSAFVHSMFGAYMNTVGKHDHLLSPDELIYVRQLRSKTVISVLAITSFIAFLLSFIIKEDLKRLRYSEKQKNKKEKKVSEDKDQEAKNEGAYRSDE